MNDLGRLQADVAAALRRAGLSDIAAIALSGAIRNEIVEPAIRAEQDRIKDAIRKYSMTKTDTLGEVAVCDAILDLVD